MPRMSPACVLCYMEIFKGLSQINWRKSEKRFLNKDFPLDIVRKSKKTLTLILRSIMQGNVSLFFLFRPLFYFYVTWKKSQHYIFQLFTFHVIKKEPKSEF